MPETPTGGLGKRQESVPRGPTKETRTLSEAEFLEKLVVHIEALARLVRERAEEIRNAPQPEDEQANDLTVSITLPEPSEAEQPRGRR